MRPAAALLLVYTDAGEWRIPLTVRSSRLRHQTGQVALPGGRLDRLDESREDGAPLGSADDWGRSLRVDRTDSTNLRMHWHRGEPIFNWECSVRELRVYDPATVEQHALKDKGFITTGDWHDIVWQIRLDRMRVTVGRPLLRQHGLGT